MTRKKFKSYYQRTGIQTHKTISCSFKGTDLEEMMWEYCRSMFFNEHKNTLTEYRWLDINPQSLIRDSLHKIGAFTGDSHKMMMGDKSDWEPGQSVKTSFYIKDAEQVREFAENQGMKVQELIREALRDYFIENGFKNTTRIRYEQHQQQQEVD